MSRHAAVVGGGLAGLTAADALSAAGAQVTVFEASPYLGGRLATPETVSLTHNSRAFTFPVEHGIHGIWRQYRNVRRLLSDRALDRHLVDSGGQELVLLDHTGPAAFLEVGRAVRRSKAPEPMAFASIFAQPEVRRLAREAGLAKTLSASRDVWHLFAFDPERDLPLYNDLTVHQLVGQWPPYLQRLFGALAHSAFFTELDQAGLDTFLCGLHHYVVRDKRDIGFDLLAEDSATALLNPLAAGVRARGGEVRLGAPVRSLVARGGHVTGVATDHGEERFDAVILALDPPGYSKVIDDDVASLLGAIDAPPAVPSISVRLWFTGRPPPERAACGLFSGPEVDNYFWLHRIQTPYATWGAATGGSAIECHQYGARAEAAQGRTDDDIIAGVSASVCRAWPDVAGTQVHAHVRRNPRTHVSFRPGVYERLPPVETAQPNVARCGDWVRSPHVVFYLERAVVTGLLAARAVAPRLNMDPARVPTPLAPFPASKGYRTAHRVLRALRAVGGLPDLSTRA